MYLADLQNHIIHDMSFVRYECNIRKIPEDKRKKIFSLETVKRMIDVASIPCFNGCEHCMSEYHIFDMTKLFR